MTKIQVSQCHIDFMSELSIQSMSILVRLVIHLLKRATSGETENTSAGKAIAAGLVHAGRPAILTVVVHFEAVSLIHRCSTKSDFRASM